MTRALLTGILIGVAAVGCATSGRNTRIVELPDFEIDAATWKESSRQEIPGGMTTVEYLPKSDSAENWTQTLTLYTLADEQGVLGASDVAHSELTEARSRCDTFEVLAMHESSRESALYEWRVPRACGDTPAQSAIERRVHGKTAVFGLSYRSRGAVMDEAAHARWQAALQGFGIKESRAPAK